MCSILIMGTCSVCSTLLRKILGIPLFVPLRSKKVWNSSVCSSSLLKILGTPLFVPFRSWQDFGTSLFVSLRSWQVLERLCSFLFSPGKLRNASVCSSLLLTVPEQLCSFLLAPEKFLFTSLFDPTIFGTYRFVLPSLRRSVGMF